MKLAILADIHGNLPTLDAVARELERLQPDYVVVNGDLINGVPFSAEVIDRIRTVDSVVVPATTSFTCSIWGRHTLRLAATTPRWGQLHWLSRCITPAPAAYLAMLPDDPAPSTCRAHSPLRITHGLPGRNRVGLYHAQPDEKIAAELRDVQEATFITAHTHVQIDRHMVWRPEDNGELSTHPHGDMHRGPHPPASGVGTSSIRAAWVCR